MLRTLVIFILFIFPVFANAEDYLGNAPVSKMFGAGVIMFGAENAPTGSTCSFFGRHFSFDATDESGKNMLSILLAAHISGKRVEIWYTPSTASGSNEKSGCNESSMAVLTKIGIN